MRVAYLAVEEDIEDVVKLSLDHLVVENVCEMRRAQEDFFQLGIACLVVLA